MENATTVILNMVTTKLIDAPIEKVWEAWNNESIVKQWWGPRKFTAPVAKMDFRIGGKSLLCMRSPEGVDIYNTWTYTDIIPLERIAFILHFSDKDGNPLNPSAIGMPPGIPDSVPHVITMERVSNNRTTINVAEFGYTSAQAVAISKAGMDECLDKMAECLGNGR